MVFTTVLLLLVIFLITDTVSCKLCGRFNGNIFEE